MNRLHVAMVRSHCKLMALGMTHSRISKTEILKLASDITGKSYKRGQHSIAATDLQTLLDNWESVE